MAMIMAATATVITVAVTAMEDTAMAVMATDSQPMTDLLPEKHAEP